MHTPLGLARPGRLVWYLGGFVRIRARGEEDATRLRSLGAGQVEVAGDLKLAASILPAAPAVLREMTERLAGRPIFLAASTHPGEEFVDTNRARCAATVSSWTADYNRATAS